MEKIMPESPENVVHNLMQTNPHIIAAAVLRGKEIIYTTDNWNISADVSKVVSSWVGQSARFIMVTGVKYSILRMEAELLVAMSYKGEGSIVAAKDDEHTLIVYLVPDGQALGAAMEVQRGITSLSTKDEGGGYFPLPYIFKPPSPPGDLALAGELQTKLPIIEQISEYEPYCKHCGADLPKGESICHVCGKKVM